MVSHIRRSLFYAHSLGRKGILVCIISRHIDIRKCVFCKEFSCLFFPVTRQSLQVACSLSAGGGRENPFLWYSNRKLRVPSFTFWLSSWAWKLSIRNEYVCFAFWWRFKPKINALFLDWLSMFMVQLVIKVELPNMSKGIVLKPAKHTII